MMTLVAILMLGAVAAFVAWPFFSPSGEDGCGESGDPSEAARWERQKADAYSAIKEVEFDHQMGKLSDADFSAQRERYAARAIEAITAIEQAKPKPKEKGAAAKNGPVRMHYCPGCGRRLPARANFCPACGQSFQAVQRAGI